MFAVGVEKVTVAAWSQYFSMTLDALQTSSVADTPQLELTALASDLLTCRNSFVLEQMQDCSSFCPSPHLVISVSVATL